MTVTEETVSAGIALLEGVLADQPTCQATHFWAWGLRQREAPGRPCGNASVTSLHVACGACGARYHLFTCRLHSWLFRYVCRLKCRSCGTIGKCRAREA